MTWYIIFYCNWQTFTMNIIRNLSYLPTLAYLSAPLYKHASPWSIIIIYVPPIIQDRCWQGVLCVLLFCLKKQDGCEVSEQEQNIDLTALSQCKMLSIADYLIPQHATNIVFFTASTIRVAGTFCSATLILSDSNRMWWYGHEYWHSALPCSWGGYYSLCIMFL